MSNTRLPIGRRLSSHRATAAIQPLRAWLAGREQRSPWYRHVSNLLLAVGIASGVAGLLAAFSIGLAWLWASGLLLIAGWLCWPGRDWAAALGMLILFWYAIALITVAIYTL